MLITLWIWLAIGGGTAMGLLALKRGRAPRPWFALGAVFPPAALVAAWAWSPRRGHRRAALPAAAAARC